VRNEVSAHPLGPVKAFRSAIATTREGHLKGVQSAQAGRQARLYQEQTSRHPALAVVSALPVPVPAGPVPAVYVMTFGAILKV